MQPAVTIGYKYNFWRRTDALADATEQQRPRWSESG